MAKLGEEEIMTIRVLAARGESNSSVARKLGVTEGAVRYHLRRAQDGATDGRGKTCLVEHLGLQSVVSQWWADQTARLSSDRPPCVKDLYLWLQADYDYPGSYKSVRRYVRSRFPAPKRRPFRRVETPPGAQSQSDWAERWVDIGDPQGPTKLYAFVMALSHSRKDAVIWSRRQDQLSWHRVHNEAFRRLGGVAAVNRIDNLKTGIAVGAGPWGVINAQYRVYARHLRFHIDAHEPRQPQQKGKVERRVQSVDRLNLKDKAFTSLEDLQAYTDRETARWHRKRLCPATGQTVEASWKAEMAFLGPLPETLPEPFDLVKTRKVHKDSTIRFEGRTYAVPFGFAFGRVEARGCAGKVRIFDEDTGMELITYPRHTRERILIDPSCYEGKATDRVLPPRPLGRMGRKLEELAAMSVDQRPVDLYAELAEVAR